MTNIAIINAGLGVPSSTRLLADRFAADIAANLGDQANVFIIDLRQHAHAIVDAMLTGFAGDELKQVIDSVAEADGLVAVTPVFNASFSGLFKSFFDVIEPKRLEGLPVTLAATGGSERHSLVTDHAMRPLFAYAGAVTMPTSVFAATSDFGNDATLDERISRASAELLTHLQQAERRRRPNPETSFVPFTELV